MLTEEEILSSVPISSFELLKEDSVDELWLIKCLNDTLKVNSNTLKADSQVILPCYEIKAYHYEYITKYYNENNGWFIDVVSAQCNSYCKSKYYRCDHIRFKVLPKKKETWWSKLWK